MQGRVLVLNLTYEPLTFVALRRAITLVMREKAEVVEAATGIVLRSARAIYEAPLVIRLRSLVRQRRGVYNVPFSRKALLVRDRHTCQYCGVEGGPLTLDHILPLSRGGGTSWLNTVAACPRCNTRKGNRTPEEAGMSLRRAPFQPRIFGFGLLVRGEADAGLLARYGVASSL
jgi:5-methylcytosine-specific restriction endonuclease McrA